MGTRAARKRGVERVMRTIMEIKLMMQSTRDLTEPGISPFEEISTQVHY